MSFINHTKCACTDRTSVRIPEPELDPNSLDEFLERNESQHHNQQSQAMSVVKAPESQLESSSLIRAIPQGLSRRSAATRNGLTQDEQDDQNEEEKLQKEQQDVLKR